MNSIINDLLSKGKEGLWWDFKQKFHNNMVAMVHDILCMANVIHNGNRYIAFGISDSLEVVGLNDSDKKYTQADIINALRGLRFSEDNIPNIQLDFLQFNEAKLAILTIFNEPLKPYYLTKEYSHQGRSIRAGVVYSRTNDANTPLDSCANPIDVRAMWFERFGLNLTAPDRFSILLEDAKCWDYDGISQAFYSNDPDFTIEIGSVEHEGGNYWWQNLYFENARQFDYHLKYKNKIIKTLPVINYYNEGLTIPFPNIEFITYPEAQDGANAEFYCEIYYYKKGTIEYSLFQHIRKSEVPCDTSQTLSTPITTQLKPPIIKLPFFIIDSDSELNELSKKIMEKYHEFNSCKSDLMRKRYPNENYNRWDVEKNFSEWVFEQINPPSGFSISE